MMLIPQPSAADERAAALRSRAGLWERDGVLTSEQRMPIELRTATEWRRVGAILHIVFFVLALGVLGAVFGFCKLVELPAGIVTSVVAIVAAEVLIRQAKLFGSGIESGLWIGGLCAFIFGLPSEGKVEALLVFALAFAIAGWRVLSPVLGGLAFILVAAYIEAKWDSSWWPPVVFCAIVTLGALLALQRRNERSSTETLFAVLVLAMPLTGYVAGKVNSVTSSANVPLAVAVSAVAVALLVVGIARRGRVELVAGFLALVAAIVELQLLVEIAYEAKLIGGGVILIAFAWFVSRVLRPRERGFVVTQTSYSRYDDAMRIAATVALAPQHEAAPVGRESGGGGFGGAGASGDF